MGLSVNILTSGFLVTVIIFFLLMGILFYSSYAKVGTVLLQNDSTKNDLAQLDSVLNSIKVAYILAFIASGLALLLALLYAGHETVVTPSEYWHLALYLITYVLLIISVIYAFIALNKLYDTRITQRNGADAYIWAGLLMSIFAFVGLTATGSGRLGMNIVRSTARNRLEVAEGKINEHLPAIRAHVEDTKANVEAHLPTIRSHVENTRAKVDEIHTATFLQPDEMAPISQPSMSSQTDMLLKSQADMLRSQASQIDQARMSSAGSFGASLGQSQPSMSQSQFLPMSFSQLPACGPGQVPCSPRK